MEDVLQEKSTSCLFKSIERLSVKNITPKFSKSIDFFSHDGRTKESKKKSLGTHVHSVIFHEFLYG